MYLSDKILDPETLTGLSPKYDEFGNKTTGNYILSFEGNDYEIELHVPNVFTPGAADGVNDIFQLRRDIDDKRSSIGFEQFELIIYNRWGEVVFETTSLTVSEEDKGSMTVGEFWNGNRINDGSPCPAGTYYWMVNYRLRGEQPESHSGTVTLVR